MLDQSLEDSTKPTAMLDPPFAEERSRPALTPLESQTLRRLRTYWPELAEPFREHIRKGRRGIFRRLFQAVVRERLTGPEQSVAWLDDGRTLQVQLRGGRTLRATVARRLALGRFDLDGPLWLFGPGGPLMLENPGDLLDLLEHEGLVPEGDAEVRKQFVRVREELENSAVNLALALTAADLRKGTIRREAARLGVQASLVYVEAMQRLDPTFSPLAFYERWVTEGHPLHPGARMRMGMEAEDVVRYAPEWGAMPGVALVAVARTACRVVSRIVEGPAEILSREYPDLRARVDETLRRMGKSPADYELIPVHPWQLAHTLPVLHAGPIARGEVILLPECTLPAYALISFRSFAPVQRRGEGKHHLKTAINVHMTSAVRTVSPNAVENGPVVSRVLAEICEREGQFGGGFAPVCEDVGIHYRPTEPGLDADTSAAQSKHLAAMFRQNPENYVRDGEIALPAAALTAESPLSSEAVVMELIEAYARRTGIYARSLAAVEFLKRYVEVSAPPFLTLMTRYGIALEGHMQNSVCVFREGELTRMLVRDLGAIRILPERLEREHLRLELMGGSAILADDLDDLRNKVYYAFFQNHLAELIVTIVRHVNIAERSLWREVAATARQAFAVLKGVPGLEQQAADDEAALFRPTLALKALTTMRLRGQVTDYSFAEVPNPLWECDAPAGGRRA
jgi:siderophore synthetase component